MTEDPIEDHELLDLLADPAGGSPELRRRLQEDPRLRANLVDHCLTEAALHRYAADLQQDHVASAQRGFGWVAVSIAACCCLAAGLVVGRWSAPTAPAPSTPVEPHYQLLSGQLLVDGQDQPPRSGSVVEAIGQHPTKLRLLDGSQADLLPGTRLRLLDSHQPDIRQKVELLQGESQFTVIPDQRRFLVRSAANTITVLGTRFTVVKGVAATPDDLVAVQVHEGRVRVDHLGGSAILDAGEHRRFHAAGLAERRIRGSLIELRPDRSIVLADQRRGRSRFGLTDNWELLLSDRQDQSTALSTGALIELRFTTDNLVDQVTVLSPQLRATILSLDRQARSLTVAPVGKNDLPPQTWPLAPDAEITWRKDPIDLADLGSGMPVKLRLTPDWSAIESISLQQKPE